MKKTTNNFRNLKVALVHDYFREYGGAERVLEEIHNMFPDSDVFTALVNPKNLQVHWYRLSDWNFKVSWFGKIPFVRDYPSLFRFWSPQIWESFDLSQYDLVISSSGWFMCKGVITRPETLHISYVHHQNKFLTYYETPDDWQQNFLKRLYGYAVGTPLRMWDFIGSQRPDVLVANSEETQRRITKYYRRDSAVIYPPIYNPHINIGEKLKKTQDYYITINRLAKPKHVDVLIQAAHDANVPLYVVGKGKEYGYLKSMAGTNITFTGEVSDIELERLKLGAKAFLFASVDEEFGMAPVEAMMYGVPVIAYKSGGLKETIVENTNGYLVDELTPQAYVRAIKKITNKNYQSLAEGAASLAERFDVAVFREKMIRLVTDHLKSRNA
ncbi:MAG: glycosyltransferase [Patescibacteria group bacterium]|jgi:glycosyltransferase involved in cell wall biosynthesis